MTWKHTGRVEAFEYISINNKDNDSKDFVGFDINKKLFKSQSLNITRQALLMLSSLNDYDQQQVIKEMYFVTNNPSSQHSLKHSRNPLLKWYRTRYPFRSYHYLISYKTVRGKVVIHDIAFDARLHGSKLEKHQQRTQLYRVEKKGNSIYDGSQNDREAQAMLSEWQSNAGNAVSQINTVHAAVNGMLNDFDKATQLMGVHVQVAYGHDNPKQYTLFHNPTDGALKDLAECAFDKAKGRGSHNAKHLAAVMLQCAKQGKKVKWTVHSQGGIIFSAALKHLASHHSSANLSGQEVAIHASGAHPAQIELRARKLNLKVNKDKTRINPFDLVPNVAAGVSKSPSSLVRCMKFMGLVTGSEEMTASPHTLPYFGMELYRRQLEMANCPKVNASHLKAVDAYLKKYPHG